MVLSRKLGQRIVCRVPNGPTIKLTVVDIDRGKIRVGIEAPREVEILREELTQGNGNGSQASQ